MSQSYENKYVQILETKDCNDTIIVADIEDISTSQPWLAAGDRVLIIQMKGGSIKYKGDRYVTPNKESGPVRYYNGAGSFEFATVEGVEAISGTSPQQYRILLENPLKNLYEATLWGGEFNGVQLVRIATDPGNSTPPFLYNDPTISSSITVPAWNGVTGGVYVLEVTSELKLNASINANGKGYEGGVASDQRLSSVHAGTKSINRVNISVLKKEKDSVSFLTNGIPDAERQEMGGGGGNSEGAGGGGDSNYGAGGIGGMQRTAANEDDLKNGGEGGNAVPYSELGVRALMGAGGGAGHAGITALTGPSRNPTDGARGGGIIIHQGGEDHG